MARRIAAWIVVVGCVLSASLLFAQEAGGKKQQGEARTGELVSALDLTVDQQAKIKEVATKYRAEIKAIADEARAKIAALRSKEDVEINALLTPEQQKKFRDFQAQKQAQRQARRQAAKEEKK